MNPYLHAIENWSDLWAGSLWRASWQGAIVLAGAWLVIRCCEFLPPRVACWIWRLACVKLLVALVWIQPLAIPLWPAPAMRIETAEIVHAPASSRAAASVPTPALPNKIDTQSPLPICACLLWLWTMGVVCRATMTTIEWQSARRLLRSARVSGDARLAQLCRQEADRIGIRRAPPIRLCRCAQGPLLAGIGRPTIVLPERLATVFDERELRLVLAHEIAHARRRDLAWNWLLTVVSWLFFFHPLVWLLMRHWSEAQEAACDELVIQRTRVVCSEYGRLLVKLSAQWPAEPRTALAMAGVLGAYRNLERRIVAMARVQRLSRVQLSVAAIVLSLVAVPGIVPWRAVAVEPQGGKQEAKTADQVAQDQTETMNQMKQIGLALHNYHDRNGSFPPSYTADAGGKPLLSWRVALLPYLDANGLYEKFHLDEPWDSDHNKALISEMPDVFRCPHAQKLGAGRTDYLAPVGESTIFPPGKGMNIRKITDGTSNTIAIVEVDDEHGVPWTKPEDWKFAPDAPVRGLGGHVEGRFTALVADGSVHWLKTKIDPDVLRELFTRSGGKPVVIPDE